MGLTAVNVCSLSTWAIIDWDPPEMVQGVGTCPKPGQSMTFPCVCIRSREKQTLSTGGVDVV